jgi:hypothetical protein
MSRLATALCLTASVCHPQSPSTDPFLAWLDRTPWSIAAALAGPLTNHLFDAMIPRFALHWDFQDLVDAIGNRRVLWTDPTNWMNRVVPLAAPYRYRYVGEGDTSLIKEFLR